MQTCFATNTSSATGKIYISVVLCWFLSVVIDYSVMFMEQLHF